MGSALERNIQLYRWSRFLRSLVFWQAVWFLYFQEILSPAEAILLYAVYDVAVTALEVPSGYMSDRIGRRVTLIFSAIAALLGAIFLGLGDSFWIFALAQIMIGIGGALASGTEESIHYESLHALGRGSEIEHSEVIAWRYSFSALALSAVTGGIMALWDPRLPFYIGAIAMVGLLWVTWRLKEPPHDTKTASETLRLRHLAGQFKVPVLQWIFVLWVLMYGFSHLPFVFGQPFILDALAPLGWEASAPAVSGAVTAVMMSVSVFISLFAERLREKLGLAMLLLFAFGLQILISMVMALTDSLIVLAFLMLRMVPDALSRPFILGRIQPLLRDDSRATWISLKSFVARLAFAGALTFSALGTAGEGTLTHPELSAILWVAVGVGVAAWAAMAIWSRRIVLDVAETPKT